MTSLPQIGSLVTTSIVCPLWGHWDSSIDFLTKTPPIDTGVPLLVTAHDGHTDRIPEGRLVHVIGPDNISGWIYVSNISPVNPSVPPPVP